MRAWRVHELGDPSKVLSFDEVEQPTPGEGQVLVKVRAAALNFPDVLMAMGMYQEKPPLPYTPGSRAVRGDRRDRAAGHRLAVRRPGAFAEYALMDADAAFPAPEGTVRREGRLALPDLPDRLRRAAPPREPAGGRVAARARRRRRRRDGGHPARQGRRREGDRHRRRRAQDRGLPRARRRPRHRLHGRGLRPDRQGGHRRPRRRRRSTTRSAATSSTSPRKCIAFEGRLVVVGFTSGRIPEAPANHLLVKNYSVVGLHWGLYRKYDPAVFGLVHEELTRLVEEGHVDPLVGETLPLDQAPQALGEAGRPQHRRQGRARPLSPGLAWAGHVPPPAPDRRHPSGRRTAAPAGGLLALRRALLRRAGVRRVGRLRHRQAGRRAVPEPAGRLPLRHPRPAPRRGFPGCAVFDCFGAGQQRHPGHLRRAQLAGGPGAGGGAVRRPPGDAAAARDPLVPGRGGGAAAGPLADEVEAPAGAPTPGRRDADELAVSTSAPTAGRSGTCCSGSASSSGRGARRARDRRGADLMGRDLRGATSGARACAAPT